MAKEGSNPGQMPTSDAEDGSDSELEWTMENAHLLWPEEEETLLGSSSDLNGLKMNDESDKEDSFSLSDESIMEQPPIYEVPIGEKKDKSPEIQDLEEVIELDRPISPNKSDIYPTIPQYLGPTRQYQQEQYCQNGMQCPPPITFVQPANPTACYYPPQSIGLISQPQRLKYGPKSMEVTCTNCHQHVHTKISKNVNSSGWICTGMFCFFAPCLFWIPVVCIDNCQDTVHKCSNCGIFLGKQCN